MKNKKVDRRRFVRYVTGKWKDGRLGTFRSMRVGKYEFGGRAYGEKRNASLGDYSGYGPLLKQIARFFESGIPPVKAEETLEIYTFMAAADESKRKKGCPVSLEAVRTRARKEAARISQKY